MISHSLITPKPIKKSKSARNLISPDNMLPKSPTKIKLSRKVPASFKRKIAKSAVLLEALAKTALIKVKQRSLSLKVIVSVTCNAESIKVAQVSKT